MPARGNLKMEDFLYQAGASFMLGAAPISEVRGAALYAFSIGQPFLMLFGVLGNIFAAFCLLLLWDSLRIQKIGRLILGKRVEAMIERYKKNHERGETIALALFIGVPVAITGVYSGILIAKILKIPNRRIITAGIAGILLASAIMYLALSGTVSVLSFLV